jgi:hypothetical protein
VSAWSGRPLWLEEELSVLSCQITVIGWQLPGAAVLQVLFALLLVRMSETIHRLRRLAQITEGSGDGQSSISFTLCLFSENL